MSNETDSYDPKIILFASRSDSAEPAATARNNRSLETAIRERVARIGQKEVARLSGIEKTKIHRLIAGGAALYLDDLHPFLAALGLGVIECDDPEMVSMPREEYEALRTLARQQLAQLVDPRSNG